MKAYKTPDYRTWEMKLWWMLDNLDADIWASIEHSVKVNQDGTITWL
jgi:hypothetical protein